MTTSPLRSRSAWSYNRHLLMSAIFSVLPIGVFAQSAPLTLDQALKQADARAASVQAANASVQASRELAVKADQLPDPTLKVGIDNLPVTGADRYSTTSDFMTMRRIGLEQEWVSSDKRKARAQRAQRAVEMEDATYLETVAKVREETATAWVNVLYQQRKLVLANEMVKNAGDGKMAAQALHRSARTTGNEVLQAQLAMTQAQELVRKSEQALRIARRTLSRWTGMPNAIVADETPVLHSHVADLPIEQLEKYHPMLLAARRAVALADADSALAVKESRPNWTIEASYAQRGGQYSNMMSFGINIPLTLNREHLQNRDIAEKAALGTKARMNYEEALRELREEIANLSITLDGDKERAASLRKDLLSAARQQITLADAAYRSGTGSLAAVFVSKKTELELQWQILDLEQEAAIAWASLEYHVIPHDMTIAGDQQ